MRQTFYQIIATIIALLLSCATAFAQKTDSTTINIENIKVIITEDGDTIKKKGKGLNGMSISIGNRGIKIGHPKKKKKHKKLHTSMHFDFGFNNIVDNTNYSGPISSRNLVATDYIATAAGDVRPLTAKDLKLRNGKSLNFNFWPIWLKQDVAKHNVQIETGLGFQFFNYRFENDVRSLGASLADDYPIFADVTDPAQLKGKEKNKLGISYASIPLMLRFNSNKKNGHRYFISGGIIGSYKLKSWTKFYGEKENGDYGLNDWMTQLSAEVGITGIIKLYGTYALQSMYRNGLDRRPFAIGIRL